VNRTHINNITNEEIRNLLILLLPNISLTVSIIEENFCKYMDKMMDNTKHDRLKLSICFLITIPIFVKGQNEELRKRGVQTKRIEESRN
jgi:hypothetical protein